MNHSVEQQARDAAEQSAKGGGDIRESVRRITLSALTKQTLDKEHIKSVVNDVSSGVISGLSTSKDQVENSVKQAVAGMDDALSKSAQATKLAIDELMGRVGAIADQDFKKALADLEVLEELFISTIDSVAQRSTQKSASAMRDLAAHMKRTGTDVGAHVKSLVQTVKSDIASHSKSSLANAKKSGEQLKTSVAEIASGVLAGMADAINPKNKR